MKKKVEVTESEYTWFQSMKNGYPPMYPESWSRRKINAMKSRNHREMRELLSQGSK